MGTREKNQISSLSATELALLEKCEVAIEKGLRTFFEVGTALAEIRAGNLYRRDYDTFEEYCRKRWELSRIHAHRLMGAAEVIQNLLPIGNKLPTHESQ